MVTAAIFFLGMFGAAAWAAVAQVGPSRTLVACLTVLSLVLTAAAVAGIVEAYTSRVFLGEDLIEVTGTFGPRRLRREDIDGYRSVKGTLVLIPRRRGLRRIGLSDPSQITAVRAWLGPDCQDVDRRELRAARAALENTPTLGETRELRSERVLRGRAIAFGLSAGAIVLTFWALLFPAPYGPVVGSAAAFLPIALATAFTFRQTVCLVPLRYEARASLFVLWFFPPLALAGRALSDFRVVETGPLWTAAVVGALPVCFAFLLADQNLRRRPSLLLLVAPFAALYAFAVVSLGNVLLDRNPATPFVATVIDKHVYRGKSVDYVLTLAPWGPVRRVTTESVSPALYAEVAVRQTVTARLRAGAFGIPWYRVGRPICPAGTTHVAPIRKVQVNWEK